MHRLKLLILFIQTTVSFCEAQYLFNDHSLPVDKRVHDLLGRLTTDEKINLLLYNSPGVERLGIPAYNWWNEALHGVGLLSGRPISTSSGTPAGVAGMKPMVKIPFLPAGSELLL
jgi:hypothetical protein